jgi:hypothetical protein
MNLFKKHVDTTIVVGAILSSFLWMNSAINDLSRDIARLDRDISVVKAVLILKSILPAEMASAPQEKE